MNGAWWDADVLVPAALAALAVWLVLVDEGRLRVLNEPGPPRWLGWWQGLPRPPRRAQVRRSQCVVAELPETLDLLAAALDAGLPPRSAAEQVLRIAPAHAAVGLAQVVHQVAVGRSDADAWASLADDPHWGNAGKELSRAVETGTGAAASLRRLAQDARRARRELVVKRARTVAVKAVWPLMACFLPAFLLVGVVPVIAGIISGGLLR